MHRLVASLFLLLALVSGLFAQAPSAAAAAPWEFIGPTNIGGRVLSVAVNPQNSGTIWAGTAGNGLWRSRSYGKNGAWQRVSLGLPVIAVSAIAISPADSNTIYVGTGEMYGYQAALTPNLDRFTQGSNGHGILKSTNGGASWSQVLAWEPSQRRAVKALRMNPQNPASLFACTSEGVYQTTNAGATWTLVLPHILAQDLVINKDDTTLVMASVGMGRTPGLGVYLSLDGGAEWFQMESFPVFNSRARLEPFAADGNVVYAAVTTDTIFSTGIWKTTDFGGTWDTVVRVRPSNNGFQTEGFMPWYNLFLAVNQENASTFFVGGAEGRFTTDGGATLINANGAGTAYLDYAHDPANAERLYLLTEAGIFVTEDFGFNIESLNQGLVTAQIQTGFSNSKTDPNFAIGQVPGSAGGLLPGGAGVTYRGTTEWEVGQGDEAGWTAISPLNDSLLYRGWRYAINVTRSSNRGASYTNGSLLGGGGGGIFIFEGGGWNAPMVMAPSNPNVLFLARPKIMKSADASDSWTAISGTLDGNYPTAMAMSWNGVDTLYVGTAPMVTTAHILRSTNGGSAWQNVTGTLPNRIPLDLAVDPFSAATVYAAFDGYGNGHLFKTTDAGANWTDISGALPDAPISAVAIDPLSSSMVYAAGDNGVYVSTDGGGSWSAFMSALPEAFHVADLVVSPANRKLRLVTRGAGVYQHDLFSPTSATVNVELRPSWNLVSIPVNAINTTPAAIFPGILPGTLFRYDGQYIAASDLEPGKAYWAKFPGGTTGQQVSGPALTTVTVSVKKGWNLVGTVGVDVPAPTGGIIESSWFEFTPTGYAVAATLKPGHGYWVKASAAGTITITAP